jgi:hypothetical protein
MGSTSAVRMARWRRRNAAGRIPLTIEIDEVALTELLVEHGMLERSRADDRVALALAVERVLEVLVRDGVTSAGCAL